MRRRAVSVDLIPEIEDVCLDDLASYCAEKTAKGEEMQCLQDNLNKLQIECKVKIKFGIFSENFLKMYFPVNRKRFQNSQKMKVVTLN